MNSTGLVADGDLGQVTAEQKDFLSRAEQASEHLLKLLNDILDITKIETGQLTLQPETIYLPDVLSEVVPMIQSGLQQKNLSLALEHSPHLPALKADRLRLRQILLNLLTNAIKFTPAGYIRVRSWPQDGMIYISVEDSGIGIEPAGLAQVFQDYQQLTSSAQPHLQSERRRHIGTGLGLSITKALVELHGGQIEVTSTLGQGTTFTFTLPAALTPAHLNVIHQQPPEKSA
jgi:signal transduction histidine kinase